MGSRMTPGWQRKATAVVDRTLDQLTDGMVADAKRYVAEDTGATKVGIHAVAATGRRAALVAERNVPGDDPKVPLYLEFGTEKMEAQPFMRPAAYRKRVL